MRAAAGQDVTREGCMLRTTSPVLCLSAASRLVGGWGNCGGAASKVGRNLPALIVDRFAMAPPSGCRYSRPSTPVAARPGTPRPAALLKTPRLSVLSRTAHTTTHLDSALVEGLMQWAWRRGRRCLQPHRRRQPLGTGTSPGRGLWFSQTIEKVTFGAKGCVFQHRSSDGAGTRRSACSASSSHLGTHSSASAFGAR
jgi:hypothetical protein